MLKNIIYLTMVMNCYVGQFFMPIKFFSEIFCTSPKIMQISNLLRKMLVFNQPIAKRGFTATKNIN